MIADAQPCAGGKAVGALKLDACWSAMLTWLSCRIGTRLFGAVSADCLSCAVVGPGACLLSSVCSIHAAAHRTSCNTSVFIPEARLAPHWRDKSQNWIESVRGSTSSCTCSTSTCMEQCGHGDGQYAGTKVPARMAKCLQFPPTFEAWPHYQARDRVSAPEPAAPARYPDGPQATATGRAGESTCC